MKKGKLYGVGTGPGDPELITLKAINTIKKCDLIAVPISGDGEALSLKIVSEAIDIKDKKIIEIDMPMTRDKALLHESHENGAKRIAEKLDEGFDVAFLTLGDPSVYSTYIYLHKRVLKLGYKAILIPGVPSFCAVAAKLNEGLVEGKEELHIIPGSYGKIDDALSLPGTKVLMKTGRSMERVVETLKEKSLLDKSKMVQKCGMEGERVFHDMNLTDESSSYFSIIVVKDGEN